MVERSFWKLHFWPFRAEIHLFVWFELDLQALLQEELLNACRAQNGKQLVQIPRCFAGFQQSIHTWAVPIWGFLLYNLLLVGSQSIHVSLAEVEVKLLWHSHVLIHSCHLSNIWQCNMDSNGGQRSNKLKLSSLSFPGGARIVAVSRKTAETKAGSKRGHTRWAERRQRYISTEIPLKKLGSWEFIKDWSKYNESFCWK